MQGARAAAITESTSRATIFIGSVFAGLVALGLIATATRIGTAFYAFGLILLSTLSFIGFVTCDRVLQSGIEELHAFRTTAGMIGVVTAVLTGPAAGLLATIAAGHSAVAGFVTGGVVGAAVLVALMWFQLSAWAHGHQQRLFEDEQERPDAG